MCMFSATRTTSDGGMSDLPVTSSTRTRASPVDSSQKTVRFDVNASVPRMSRVEFASGKTDFSTSHIGLIRDPEWSIRRYTGWIRSSRPPITRTGRAF